MNKTLTKTKDFFKREKEALRKIIKAYLFTLPYVYVF